MTEGNLDPPTDQYPQVIRAAAKVYLDCGLEAGRLALAPIAGEIWRGLSRSRLPPARHAAPAPPADEGRSFNVKRHAATFLRDEFRCRYCGGETIPRPVAVLMHSLYPTELPFHPHYKSGCMHPLFWTRVAEADHLFAGSVGGAWRDPENHVTACVRCNTKKSNRSIEELGWILKRPVGGWDGLTSLYLAIWERAGRPQPRIHKEWLRALQCSPPAI